MCDRSPCGTCIGTIKAGGILTKSLEFAKLCILFSSRKTDLSFSSRRNGAIFLNVTRRLSRIRIRRRHCTREQSLLFRRRRQERRDGRMRGHCGAFHKQRADERRWPKMTRVNPECDADTNHFFSSETSSYVCFHLSWLLHLYFALPLYSAMVPSKPSMSSQ